MAYCGAPYEICLVKKSGADIYADVVLQYFHACSIGMATADVSNHFPSSIIRQLKTPKELLPVLHWRFVFLSFGVDDECNNAAGTIPETAERYQGTQPGGAQSVRMVILAPMPQLIYPQSNRHHGQSSAASSSFLGDQQRMSLITIMDENIIIICRTAEHGSRHIEYDRA